MFKCANCGEKFDNQTAYCVDWRDSLRSFGCPHCKVFLKKLWKSEPPKHKFSVKKWLVLFLLGTPIVAFLGAGVTYIFGLEYGIRDVISSAFLFLVLSSLSQFNGGARLTEVVEC